MEELKDAWISYKDSPELIWLLLEFSSRRPLLFEQCKVRNVQDLYLWRYLMFYDLSLKWYFAFHSLYFLTYMFKQS